ncbi:hypothetical protein CYLTODRAFT_416993 [Cylindrobasidium torrendii FP15055 ss-10]|uniref:TPX2 C-terminal domain-containing protein n=1 Tax=Cylindrobasidium torrendii FP15055 ss-10 TaxID=1314674 RepID=A0A0D7BTW5_9AGAR|nr:hypothetical protein CYLTODRAFT_416993 [Cylindrobasidium torrendii FP15055 ss-10]
MVRERDVSNRHLPNITMDDDLLASTSFPGEISQSFNLGNETDMSFQIPTGPNGDMLFDVDDDFFRHAKDPSMLASPQRRNVADLTLGELTPSPRKSSPKKRGKKSMAVASTPRRRSPRKHVSSELPSPRVLTPVNEATPPAPKAKSQKSPKAPSPLLSPSRFDTLRAELHTFSQDDYEAEPTHRDMIVPMRFNDSEEMELSPRGADAEDNETDVFNEPAAPIPAPVPTPTPAWLRKKVSIPVQVLQREEEDVEEDMDLDDEVIAPTVRERTPSPAEPEDAPTPIPAATSLPVLEEDASRLSHDDAPSPIPMADSERMCAEDAQPEMENDSSIVPEEYKPAGPHEIGDAVKLVPIPSANAPITPVNTVPSVTTSSNTQASRPSSPLSAPTKREAATNEETAAVEQPRKKLRLDPAAAPASKKKVGLPPQKPMPPAAVRAAARRGRAVSGGTRVAQGSKPRVASGSKPLSSSGPPFGSAPKPPVPKVTVPAPVRKVVVPPPPPKAVVPPVTKPQPPIRGHSRSVSTNAAGPSKSTTTVAKPFTFRTALPNRQRVPSDSAEAGPSVSDPDLFGFGASASSSVNSRPAKRPAIPPPGPELQAVKAKMGLVPTVPIAPHLSTDLRLKERKEFEEKVKAKEREAERLKEEERLRKEEEDEKEMKEMRKKTIVRAHDVPEWYKDLPKKEKD